MDKIDLIGVFIKIKIKIKKERKKVFLLESKRHKIILFIEKEDYSQYLFCISKDSSVEILLRDIQEILNIKNKDSNSFEYIILKKKSFDIINKYDLLIKLKKNIHITHEEIKAIEYVKNFEKKITIIDQETNESFFRCQFLLEEGITVDSAIRDIKYIIEKEYNKKENIKKRIWEKGYIVSNYKEMNNTLINVINEKIKQGKRDEIKNIFHSNIMLAEQFSVFKNMAE